MSRNEIYDALFYLGANASVNGAPAFVETGRRLKTPDQAQLPALFQVEPMETFKSRNGQLTIRDFDVFWFVYHAAGADQTAVPASTSADIFDAIEAAMAPPFAGAFQTLGGLVQSAFIDGQVKRWDGDLDGISIMMIPIKLVVPVQPQPASFSSSLVTPSGPGAGPGPTTLQA